MSLFFHDDHCSEIMHMNLCTIQPNYFFLPKSEYKSSMAEIEDSLHSETEIEVPDIESHPPLKREDNHNPLSNANDPSKQEIPFSSKFDTSSVSNMMHNEYILSRLG